MARLISGVDDTGSIKPLKISSDGSLKVAGSGGGGGDASAAKQDEIIASIDDVADVLEGELEGVTGVKNYLQDIAESLWVYDGGSRFNNVPWLIQSVRAEIESLISKAEDSRNRFTPEDLSLGEGGFRVYAIPYSDKMLLQVNVTNSTAPVELAIEVTASLTSSGPDVIYSSIKGDDTNYILSGDGSYTIRATGVFGSFLKVAVLSGGPVQLSGVVGFR